MTFLVGLITSVVKPEIQLTGSLTPTFMPRSSLISK